MPELRKCPQGHEYWWPGAQWQHDKCAINTVAINESAINAPAINRTPNRRDREAYNAYMREYMKRRRAKD